MRASVLGGLLTQGPCSLAPVRAAVAAGRRCPGVLLRAHGDSGSGSSNTTTTTSSPTPHAPATPQPPAPAPASTPAPQPGQPVTPTAAGDGPAHSPAPQTSASEPSSSSSPSTPAASGAGDDEIVEELGAMWESIKKDMRKGMKPEEAQVLESIKVEDLVDSEPGDLMRKLADQQLGPMLSSMGISEDPLAFFTDLLRLGAALQLISAAVLFYGAELGAGMDAGEAFRCVTGLGLGYLSRPFIQVEVLLWPVYDWIIRRVAPGAVYEVDMSAEARQSTLNKLGVSVAAAFLLPQLLWGWDQEACLQLVLPMAGGWFLFDITFCAALLYKLRML